MRRGDGSNDDIHGWMTRFVGFGDDFLGRRTEAGSAYVVGRGHAESILGKRSKIGKNVTGILGIRGEDLLSGRWLVRLPLGPRRSPPPPRIVAISAVSGVVISVNVTSSSGDGATRSHFTEYLILNGEVTGGRVAFDAVQVNGNTSGLSPSLADHGF